MKKKILLFTLTAGFCYVGLTSLRMGPATSSTAGNRTGAKSTTTNCGGPGCHGGTSASTIAKIRVDSAGGVEVAQYVAGMAYTVTVTGKHPTLPAFGFQFASVSGTGAAQLQAGVCSALPSGVAEHTLTGLKLIEQTDTIAAPSPADSFSKSFTWTAPAAGTGTVSMYLTVNAVNGNLMVDAGDGCANTSITLTEYTPPSSVGSLSKRIGAMAYPNPVSNQLNVDLSGLNGVVSINVIDLAGRNVYSTRTNEKMLNINTSDWASGLYNLIVTDDAGKEVIRIAK